MKQSDIFLIQMKPILNMCISLSLSLYIQKLPALGINLFNQGLIFTGSYTTTFLGYVVRILYCLFQDIFKCENRDRDEVFVALCAVESPGFVGQVFEMQKVYVGVLSARDSCTYHFSIFMQYSKLIIKNKRATFPSLYVLLYFVGFIL